MDGDIIGNHWFCLVATSKHSKCTPSGYLKHPSDVYPPTGYEHSLLPSRECLILKPPFWKKQNWMPWKRPCFVSSGAASWQYGFRVPFVFQCLRWLSFPFNKASFDPFSRDLDLRSKCGSDHETCPQLKVVAHGSIQWNFTHYTYTCSSGGLESDTLHLHLRGPRGVEFYTEHFRPPCTRFSRVCFKQRSVLWGLLLHEFITMKPLQFAFLFFFFRWFLSTIF